MFTAELDAGLQQLPASAVAREAIADQLWGIQKTDRCLQRSPCNLDAYWSYYHRECSNALHDGGRHIAARTHRNILDAAKEIRSGTTRERLKISLRKSLKTAHVNEDELLDNWINLTASVMLMIDFGGHPCAFSGRSQLSWKSGTLQNYIHSHFEENPLAGFEKMKLEKIFVARNLVKIAGLEIVWTDNLADHLRLTDDDRRVHIYHHASFLERQRQCTGSLLLQGLAEETLRTLALLFPSTDPSTKSWIFRLPDRGVLDIQVVQCGRLKTDERRIDKFKFWRDRLVSLKQVFDESQPETISQWWHDQRNGVQWYTFWVAVLVLVLTVIFGLIQSIEGGLQVYASFQAIQGPSPCSCNNVTTKL